MKLIKRSWDFLGSRNLSVFIFVMGMVYYLLLYAFSLLVPDWWLNNLSKLLPYQVFYALFVINLVICEIKWIPVIMRRCKKIQAPKVPEELNRFREKMEIEAARINVKKLASRLRMRFYAVKQGEASNDFLMLYACRGRFSPLGNLMFHIAIILILIGIYVSLQYRFEGKVYLVEGQKFTGTYGEYAKLHVSPGADFMKEPFQVRYIKTNFWETQLLFTDLKAEIKAATGEVFPVWLSKAGNIDGHRITIQEVSYTLNYKLRDKNGRVADEGAVNLANFGPGTFDSFRIPGFPYKISVSVYPDAYFSKGVIENRSMNLNNPAYHVKVMKNKQLLYSSYVRKKGLVVFDGFTLSFPDINYNGAFSIVRDPGLWWIITSFFIMILGLLWRMVFCRNEVVLVREGEKIAMYVRSDYYPVTFMEKYSKVALK